MIKAWIFGRHSVGDEILLKLVKDSLDVPVEYLGEKVDLSRIDPVDENIVIVINNQLYNIDLTKILGYMRKDLSKPLVVVKKMRTFGAVVFEKDLNIRDVITNKIYVFSGIFYLPKQYIKNTMSATFRGIDKKELRTYIINNWRKR